ncbi:MAG: type II and III secretion system protein [Planctomycetes bacterium]|nr:type II and III secretion system protein [Planctomycetota bacterium]
MIAFIGQQVAIETRFLLVDENFLEDIGLDTNIMRFQTGIDKIEGDGVLRPGDDAFQSYEATTPQNTGITSTLAEAGSALLGNPAMSFDFAYGGVLDDLQVNFTVRATQMHANSRTLTAPKLMVLSGETGSISVIKNRPYVADVTFTSDTSTTDAGAAGQAFTVQYLERDMETIQTGIQMSVTPTITADKKYVILRIITSLIDEIGAGAQNSLTYTIGDGTTDEVFWEEPVTENTSVQTRVLVPDSGTVLLGGLTLTAEKEIESGVPILSKIPILNRFFSNRSEVKDKQILLILVKPTIILKDEAEEDAIAAMEY